jgi:hypothetical protein
LYSRYTGACSPSPRKERSIAVLAEVGAVTSRPSRSPTARPLSSRCADDRRARRGCCGRGRPTLLSPWEASRSGRLRGSKPIWGFQWDFACYSARRGENVKFPTALMRRGPIAKSMPTWHATLAVKRGQSPIGPALVH